MSPITGYVSGCLGSVAPGYAGPGNVVSGAIIWCGLRAYSVSTIGANAIRLRRDSDNTEQDFVTVAGGGLDLAGITSFKGAANLFITKLYDQIGTNHFTQATAGFQPSFTLNGLGSLPIATFVRANVSNFQGTSGIVQAQPLTASMVMERLSVPVSNQNTWDQNGAPFIGAAFTTSANQYQMYISGGTNLNATATDNVFHAFQMVYNGASSDNNVDGTPTTGNIGASTGLNNASPLVLGQFDNSGDAFDGILQEFGIWGSAFSSSQSSMMSSNQHAYWGF